MERGPEPLTMVEEWWDLWIGATSATPAAPETSARAARVTMTE